jgi:hypothetical protein
MRFWRVWEGAYITAGIKSWFDYRQRNGMAWFPFIFRLGSEYTLEF